MKALIIPSATLIPVEMRKSFGTIPTCLFPLGNSTMLQLLCDKYKDVADEIYVLANLEEQQISNYIELRKLPVQLIHIDELHDLGYTIRCGLETVCAKAVDEVFINFADTLLSNPLSHEARDIVYYAKQAADEDWSYFDEHNGRICSVTDKGTRDVGSERLQNVFVGVFEISHPMQFLDALIKEQACLDDGRESFYSALTAYSQQTPLKFLLAGKWFDVGHSERYYHAKTNVEARAFNAIEIDEDRGILRKRSENREKLIDEIGWYLKLPSKLQYLTPRIYEYSLHPDDPYVSMEYYGYNTLHEVLIYGDTPKAQWRRCFERLLFALRDMRCFQIHDMDESVTASLKKMYLQKTVERLEKLRRDENFSAFFNREILINGKAFPSLDTCLKLLPQILHTRLIQNNQISFCVIHGDLHFSNILVENRFGFMRLVDPRGRFGEFDIYGDQRYELAKLMHSIDGQYDFIIEDMFAIQVSDSSIVLEMPEKSKPVYAVFRDVFREFMADYDDLKLIESTLFLSMIPLHSDHLNRQYAMLATGLRLLDEATGGNLNG